jgi:hypothetical protein
MGSGKWIEIRSLIIHSIWENIWLGWRIDED